MLLERDDDRRALDEALDRVRETGRGETALVGAEAGGGKTSLLRAMAANVEANVEADVWWGSCDNLRSPRPLGPLADMAAAAGGTLERAFADGASRRDVFDAALETLRLNPEPVVMVIEDLHWADDATLDLVTFLGRRIDRVATLLVLSYRDDEIGAAHPLRAVLAEVAGSVRTRRHLAPLSAEAVGLLPRPLGVDGATLYRRTGGNPFFVTECIAAGAAVVPPSVADAVLGRAARLEPAARPALDAAAVEPGHIELWLLDALAGAASTGVDACVEAGMLVATHDGVAFRHELARVAVLDALPPSRRRRLHRAALAALERATTSVDVARLAFHAEEADDGAAILRHSPVAARAAIAVGAHRAAVAHLTAAVRVAHAVSPAEQISLYGTLAHELHVLGRADDAVTAFEAAIAIAHETGDARKRGELLVRLKPPLVAAGRQAEADASTREGTAILEQLEPGPELVAAYIAMTGTHMLAREFAPAAHWGDRALAVATDLGDVADMADALIQSGVALLMAGDDEGHARLTRGIALARQHGSDGLVALGLTQLGSGAGEVRRYDLAVPALTEAVAWAESRELITSELYGTAWLARCALETGHWDDTGEKASRLLGRPGCTGISRMTALMVLGRLRARRADPGVWEALDEALELARQTGHLQRLWPAAAARAEAAWLEDRLADEAAVLEETSAMAERLEYPWAVGELGFWRWRAGAIHSLPASAAPPFALHVQGRYGEAAAAWTALGCPYEAALAAADSEDTDRLRAAFVTFADLGATPMVQRVGSLLRARGDALPRQPRVSTRKNPFALTARELDVAVLVADGLTNAEIGERLFISPKTVDHHVSSLLAKLGVPTRRAAAREVHRLGLRSR